MIRGAGDRTGLAIGALALVLGIVAYPVLQTAEWQPLAIFAVPPLLAAIYARWRVIVLLGVLSVAAGALLSWATGIDLAPAAARMITFVVVIGCGTAAAVARDRRQQALDEANRSTEAFSAFEAGLIGSSPHVPGFSVVARYQPAEPLLRLSGDFVDAMPDRHGGLAFVVGDVSGHGASEAALGASLRAGWRAVANALPGDPVGWLEALRDAFFLGEEHDHYATVCTGVVRTDGLTLVVSAGHPWPVVLGTPPAVVDMKVGLPLGIDADSTWEPTPLRLVAPLLVYTDGLVEAPDAVSGRWGEDGLMGWLATARYDGPDHLADALVEAAMRGRSPNDDIAVVIVGATPGCRSAAGAGAAPAPAAP